MKMNCGFCWHETPIRKCYCAKILCDEVTPEGVQDDNNNLEDGCEKYVSVKVKNFVSTQRL